VPRTATADRVDREQLLAFLRGRTHAVLLTRRSSGAPQLSPVTYGVDGEGRVVVSTYRSISGEHPDWDEYRAAMTRQGKSLLRITPTGWGPVATGGFPPEVAGKL
jgi:hypothetical protein